MPMAKVAPGHYVVGEITIKDGTATGRYGVNELRVKYTEIAVKDAIGWAKDKGWGVTRVSDTKLTLSRR